METTDIIDLTRQWDSLDYGFKNLEGLHKSYSKSVDEMRKERTECQKVVTQHLQRFDQISEAVQREDVEVEK